MQSYCPVYAPHDVNLNQQVLDHCSNIIHNIAQSHSFVLPQKITINLFILKRQLLFHIELYMRLLINFNHYICTLLTENTSIKQKCQRIKLKLMQSFILAHDFAVSIRQLQAHCVGNITLLHQLILHHYIQYTIKFLAELLSYIHLKSYIHIKSYTHVRQNISNTSNSYEYTRVNHIGGGSKFFSIAELSPYIQTNIVYENVKFCYKDYVKTSQLYHGANIIQCSVPFAILLPKLTLDQLKVISASHGIFLSTRVSHADIQANINKHTCINCNHYISVFDIIDIKKLTQTKKMANVQAVKQYQAKKGAGYKAENLKSVKKYQKKKGDEYKSNHSKSEKTYKDKKKVQDKFPPLPVTPALQHMIISNACQDMSSDQISESGCAVCGQLTLVKDLIKLSEAHVDLNILINPGITQVERFTSEDPIKDIDGPVLVKSLHKLCKTCHKSLLKDKIPLASLANGKWLGDIPNQLLDLSFAEQLLLQECDIIDV